MKLVFPNGEHGQLLLNSGANRIGSDPDAAAVLRQPGIQPTHCVIHLTSNGANLQVPAGGGPVSVNGKPVTDIMGLRSGDLIDIGPVVAKLLLVEEARSYSADLGDEDENATRLRPAVPKFMLRGMSGAVFSKLFPITGPVVIGRAAECDIPVPADEMSRRHAMVRPTPDGVSVEDLGSSNGTFVNGKRVQQGFLNPGDELRLDAVRFVLVAPGMEMNPMPAMPSAKSGRAMPGAQKMQMWASIMLTLAAIVVIALLLTQR
jgi:pSer/pThr/pTyr-binding forkhead associated (FHA) protein